MNQQIEKKWIKKWEEAKVFEANPDERKKFFATFPYPYVNAYSHIGHFYTIMRVEALCRYKRLKGYNVLFPQGFHATGSPIISAAKKVKDLESKQISIMKDMGFDDKEIKKFEDPEYWVKFFVPEFIKDYKNMGLGIDWRRSFVTTSMNPHYDKFIRWQFRKLKEKNYVVKGSFPVVWCTNCGNAIGDHSRSKGEGETAQEFTLLKFKFKDEYIIAATLRPETVYGQTNLWLDAENEYVKIEVSDKKKGIEKEIWIVSEECSEKLKEQSYEVKKIGKILGQDLLGKKAKAPGIDRELIILPSYFCDSSKGTGIVTSVPSDAPDDYIGLRDLQENEEECKKYGLDHEEIKSIKPIAIIDTDIGEMAAVKMVEDLKIKNQHERKKLEEAKKIVYKKGFYEGVMNKNCGQYAGMKVEQAKEQVKKLLLDNKEAELFYELTGEVVCRCLNKGTIKIVDDQWFLDYGNLEWKKQVHKCLDRMELFPEKSRLQFDYVIDWLRNWACTRETGLGTKLPWDEKWLIESLSDSTVYMSYYTIAHMIKDVEPEKIDDNFFDYVFLDGEKPNIENVEEMKKEYNYWYPMDFRNSGKDLIQNHLVFMIFNHTAIFPEEKWPKGIGVNGWITVDGQKMSKSLGNMIPLRDMPEKFGIDVSRITILSGGEELDDPNWDSEFAKSLKTKLNSFADFIEKNYNSGEGENLADKWLESKINSIILDVTECMEKTLFRSAIQKIFFEIQNAIKWYLRRGKPNKKLMNKIIETQLIMLSPFAPFICEEMWEKIGKKGFILDSEWPNVGKIDKKLDIKEENLKTVMNDIQSVLKLVNISAKKIKIIVSDIWKYNLYNDLRELIKESRNPGDIMKNIMNEEKYKIHGKEIQKIIPKFVKKPEINILTQDEEVDAYEEAKEFLINEFKCEIEIVRAQMSKEVKAKNASPGKPAILVE